MKDKRHKNILKAFLNSKIPEVIANSSDSICQYIANTQKYSKILLKGKTISDLQSEQLLTKDKKEFFSEHIRNSSGEEKMELVIYYRLLILVDSIITFYHKNNVISSNN